VYVQSPPPVGQFQNGSTDWQLAAQPSPATGKHWPPPTQGVLFTHGVFGGAVPPLQIPPSSQISLDEAKPSPHFSHGRLANGQIHPPGSTVQAAEQPSFGFRLPSSQPSALSFAPLPQR
jgi:hypothetical protein